jgi:hemoglobin-like flavoprotein
MGAAAAVLAARWQPRHLHITSLFQHFCAGDTYIPDILSAPLEYGPVDAALLDECKQCMKQMIRTSTGRVNLFAVFWSVAKIVDVNREMIPIFEQRAWALKADRNSVIFRMIWFMLCIPSDDKRIKYRLRALGRYHVKLGIKERQLRIFGDCILKSVAVCTQSSAAETLLKQWTDVILFIIHQMCFDNVYYVPRMHELRRLRLVSADGSEILSSAAEETEVICQGDRSSGDNLDEDPLLA